MTKLQELLTIWTNLQTKILSLQPLHQNKELIVEAVELYLHHASALTSEHSSEHLLDQRGLKKEKESLTRELEKLTRRQEDHPQDERDQQYFASEQERISNLLLAIDQALSDNSVQAAFTRQKEKNEQLVKECQELLSKLTE